ncbi:MAG: putative selenoprotein [Candidatus Methylopumilus sp.]|nr:putative selenoprotein [Candidatus Methylopumilus sp.]
MINFFKNCYHFLRQLSGDHLYDLYCKQHKGHKHPIMDRKTFYQLRLEKKWSGIKRCC